MLFLILPRKLWTSVRSISVWKIISRREWLILLFSVTLSVFYFFVDCEKDTELTLLSSGKKLSEETVKTPLIAISNYLFNGLREEAISISHGIVSEGYVTVSTDRE